MHVSCGARAQRVCAARRARAAAAEMAGAALLRGAVQEDPSLTAQTLIYLDDVGEQVHSLGVGGIGRAQASAAHVASVISVSNGPEATLVSPVKTNCCRACIGSKSPEALDSLQAPHQETLPLSPTMMAGAWRWRRAVCWRPSAAWRCGWHQNKRPPLCPRREPRISCQVLDQYQDLEPQGLTRRCCAALFNSVCLRLALSDRAMITPAPEALHASSSTQPDQIAVGLDSSRQSVRKELAAGGMLAAASADARPTGPPVRAHLRPCSSHEALDQRSIRFHCAGSACGAVCRRRGGALPQRVATAGPH